MYYTTTTVVVVAYLDEDNNKKNTRSDDDKEVFRDHAMRRHWCEKPAKVLEGAASPGEQQM